MRARPLLIRRADNHVQTTLTPADFSAAQVDFVPHSLRDVKLQKSDIAWADIGGTCFVLI